MKKFTNNEGSVAMYPVKEGFVIVAFDVAAVFPTLEIAEAVYTGVYRLLKGCV